MTVAETTNPIRNDYTGNGTSTAFNFTFEVLEEANVAANKIFTIKVLLVESGIETEQVEDTDYTVARDADTRLGVITFTTAPTATESIVFLSDIQSTQATDYINIGTGKFPATSHEGTVDKLTLLARQQGEEIGRAILLPESSPLTNVTIPVSPANANKAIVVNAAGDDLDAQSLIDLDLFPVTTYAEGILAAETAAAARVVLDAEQKASSLTAITTLQDVDQFIVADNSDSDNSKKITLDTLRDGILGSNLIINGQGSVRQRGSTFNSATSPGNSDDTYLLDRMLLLSDGSDIVDVSQETTTVPIGSYSAIKFDQETANKQWGYVQILEARDAAAIIGGKASLSFKARKGGSNATLDTLRVALVSWDSTPDNVTSDIVGTWAGAGTDPTLATNWTYENTPSNLTLTTSYQTFKVEDISIDTASTANVALFIWLDDTDATVADTAFISNIKVEPGSVATPYEARPFGQELYLSKRFFRKSFNESIAPAQSAGLAGALFMKSQAASAGPSVWVQFDPLMRTAPSMTTFNPSASNANWRNTTAGSDINVTVSNIGDGGAFIESNTQVTSQFDVVAIHYSADGEV